VKREGFAAIGGGQVAALRQGLRIDLKLRIPRGLGLHDPLFVVGRNGFGSQSKSGELSIVIANGRMPV
jgi:hypothetical protein